MARSKIIVTVNSTVLYVIAFLITTIIHEFSHAFFGMLFNSDPILHHNYVEHFSIDQLTQGQKILVALAGPVTSLIQGIISAAFYLNSKKQSLFTLFLLWLAVLGFNNFFGYVMTGPIFANGDIGKAYLLMNTPVFVQVVLAIIGAAVLVFIAYKLTFPFLKFSYDQKFVASKHARKNFSFHIIILPWLIGSGIMTFFYMPIVAIISIIYPLMSGMIFIFPWQNAARIENVEISKNRNIGELSFISIGSLMILIAIFKWILSPGINFFS